ncbi:MAG: cysteine desulfurase [Clostridia bacterium]|nr:cysteine desulfurase [Clostridia bacterium]
MKIEKIIYADNAATTKLDIEAFEAMKLFLLESYANASQPYSFSRATKQAIKEARELIARCINAEPDEIYFTSGGTESDNWAIKGIAFNDLSHKAIITSNIEHHAILNSCKQVEKFGVPVAYLSANNEAIITLEILEQYITPQTKLVSIMMANNEVGSIQPVKELSSLAHYNGALFHTDAVQAVGHIPVDVKKLGVDLLSASAHKFNGPKGVGFLYIKKGTNIIAHENGGQQEYALRAGTENVAAIVGMAIALNNNCKQLVYNSEHITKIEKHFLSLLAKNNIDFIVNGSKAHVPGNISLSIRNADGEMLLHRLDILNIMVSTGAACDSKNTQISHVLKAINLPEEYAKGTIRVSFGKDNSLQDAELIANSIKQILT